MPEKKKLNSKRGLDSLHQGKKREKNSFCSPPEKKLAYHLVGVSKVTLGASLLSVGKLAAISPSTHVVQGLTALSCHKGPIFGYNDTHATLIL